VTIDAMGWQKAIAQAMWIAKADYLFDRQDNQPIC